jgi:hypothetical protein
LSLLGSAVARRGSDARARAGKRNLCVAPRRAAPRLRLRCALTARGRDRALATLPAEKREGVTLRWRPLRCLEGTASDQLSVVLTPN